MTHVKRKREPEDCARTTMAKAPYFGDPKLLGRVRQYAETQKSQKIDIGLMAEALQNKYSEYSRKKKGAFKKSVEKAYSVCKVSKQGKQKDQAARLEDDFLKAKRSRKDPSHDDSDDSSSGSYSSDNEEYVLYKDTNAMNSFLTDLYKKPPGGSRSQPASRAPSRPPSTASSPGRYESDPGTGGGTGGGGQGGGGQGGGGTGGGGGQGGQGGGRQGFVVDRKGDRSAAIGSPVRRTLDTVMEKINDVLQEAKDVKPASPSRPLQVTYAPGEATPKSAVDESEEKDFLTATDTSLVSKTPVKKTSLEKEASKETPAAVKTVKKKSAKGSSKETKEKSTKVQKSTIKFADIGGNDSTLKEVCKLLVHMKHPELYRQLGVTPPQGFLLHGPPGCGKTLLAHAIAGELDLPFIKMAATEVVSGVSGESEEKIRDLFQTAMSSAPCVLFLDEIDSITPKRETASKDMERRIVSQLLTCMDELNSKESGYVLVIGATNRPDSLDPALRRAGRFDREISLGIPDEAARRRIAEVLCRDLRLSQDFDYSHLARSTPGYVGADLMALAREAAMVAVNRMLGDIQEDFVHKNTDTTHIVRTESVTLETSDTGCVTIPAPHSTDSSSEPNPEQPVSEPPVPMAGQDLPAHPVPAAGVRDEEAMETTGVAIETIPVAIETIDANKDCDTALSDNTGFSVNKQLPDVELTTVLSWLKEQPPLTEQQLATLYITMGDFEAALKVVQPSAKREGFATIPDVTWADIGALSAVREELQMAILAPVQHPEEFQSLGLSNPPGVLLAGPPGCGKTLLAKAIANESGINFISVKGPELLNMYVGESERAVRQVFQRARNSSPCVIFFDELDALCPRRSDHGEGGASVRVVNQLLTEMDGLEARKQVYIMGATNRPDIIDPAILRPGRLDKILYVGLPTAEDRLDILNTITKNGVKPKLDSDVDLKEVAENVGCTGYTGADLAALVREASTAALKEFMTSSHKTGTAISVGRRHFAIALNKVKPSVSEKDHLLYASMKDRLSTS